LIGVRGPQMKRRSCDFDLVFAQIEADLKAIRLDLAEIIGWYRR